MYVVHKYVYVLRVYKCIRIYAYTYIRITYIDVSPLCYGVASVSRTDKIIGLFCKRALQKRRYSAKETHDFIDPDRSHPILWHPYRFWGLYICCVYTRIRTSTNMHLHITRVICTYYTCDMLHTCVYHTCNILHMCIHITHVICYTCVYTYTHKYTCIYIVHMWMSARCAAIACTPFLGPVTFSVYVYMSVWIHIHITYIQISSRCAVVAIMSWLRLVGSFKS